MARPEPHTLGTAQAAGKKRKEGKKNSTNKTIVQNLLFRIIVYIVIRNIKI